MEYVVVFMPRKLAKERHSRSLNYDSVGELFVEGVEGDNLSLAYPVAALEVCE
jgi:hypothetical protein